MAPRTRANRDRASENESEPQREQNQDTRELNENPLQQFVELLVRALQSRPQVNVNPSSSVSPITTVKDFKTVRASRV